MTKKEQINSIKLDFEDLQSLLTAVGDPSRQQILLVLMEHADCSVGMRVGDITSRTHLSRPAVSHQLKDLKDIGILGLRNEGTKNFYFIDVKNNRAMFGKMSKLVDDINGLMGMIEASK
jgi:DNA-binding transcriptional ArsR family regulator